MRNRLMAALAGALVATMNFAAMGCGTPEEQIPTEDAGTPETDAGTEADGGQTAGDPDTVLTLTRFNADGTVDTAFGTNGTSKLDLETNEKTTRESLWAADVDGQNRIVLFGSKKGEGSRTDADRYVARATADGKLDETFATGGVHTLNMNDLSDQARVGFVQPDGKILASGYVSAPTGVGDQKANKIVLLRLNEDGTPDNGFGTAGVAEANPFMTTDGTTPWGMAEAYAAGLQSTGGYVTTGYGRELSSGKVDVVSFRFSSAGQLDNSWNTTGKQVLDIAGDDDRGRNLVVLPDDRVLMVGSGKPSATNLDGMAVMLTRDGALDATFGTNGRKLYEFGRPDEAFFAAAANATTAAAAGYRAGDAAGVKEDDDATLLILPLAGGTEFAKEVPFSETEDDRIWGVTFDAAGKILATGFVANGDDTQTVVARFNADGTRDTTFGNGGVVVVNVAAAGNLEAGRAVVVQSDGKIVVAGLAEKQ